MNMLLSQHGLLPSFSKERNSEWAEIMKSPPLALRAKGLTEALSPFELGRAFYHLAQLRHYKGREIEEDKTRETEESADEKKAKPGRDQTIQTLKKSGLTLGQMLAEDAPADGEMPTARTRGIHALRSHVEDEFDRLVTAQAPHHPILCDIAFMARFRDTIFAQRPVFWRKNTLGQCRFIPGGPLCPKGSWLSQQRRMLEKLNNLALVGGNMRPLDDEERAVILDKLQTQASMSWAGVRAALKPLYKKRGEPGEEKTLRFNLELGGEAKLLGNTVEAKLVGVFGDAWNDHPHKQAIRDAIHERLWKADYGEIGEQRVVILSEDERRERRTAEAKRFVDDFGISQQEASALADLKLPAGWEPYSIDTLKAFLPRLEEGVRFGALTMGPEWADWRKANFPDQQQPTGEILDRLPSPADRDEQKRQATIRNPTVIRVQNELRKVVNNLIGAYGKPDLIRIELARQIGLSKYERKKMKEGIDKQEKRRKEAEDDLQKKGISPPSRADVEKWMLWKESQERCPYTGDQIGFGALFGTREFEVEHIWPRSRSLDNSFRNKTLCRRDVNLAKGNRTPFEFYQGSPDAWSAITGRLQNLVARKGSPGIPLAKVKRFLATSMPDDFASRQLNDTGYAARQAMAFLKRLWRDVGPETPVRVQAVTGRVTAQLRRLWGLNNILSEDGEKTRADHRHHAIDALVVACTDPGITNRLSWYWQQKDDQTAECPHLPPPWPGIRDEAERTVAAIIVSHRVRKKVSGPLHLETTYGDTGKDIVRNRVKYRQFVTRKPIVSLTFKQLEAIRDGHIRKTAKDWVATNGGDPKKAFGSFPKNSPDGPEIRKARIIVEQQPGLMTPVSTGYASTDNNHHLAIYRSEDGKIDWKIISMIEAARRLARQEPIVSKSLPNGSRLVMSIALGDTIRIDQGDKAGYWVAKALSANGQIFFRHVEDAIGATKWGPKANTLLKEGAKKVSVDPIGRVRPAND
ncbi:putative cytosolic protein [Granulibacter bethesdensis]|uniref:CRISPR-associated endonuclease Cas9 n=1 Tax=Granulibacter bethesdensis TaxID=364410 RepID=A0AAN0RE95_9PROT|nr:putative cytosolic protein [Granulibacter bethesdensis]